MLTCSIIFAPSSIFREWSSSYKKSLLDNDLNANICSSFSYVCFTVSSIALHNMSSVRCCSIDHLTSSSRSSHSTFIMVSDFWLLFLACQDYAETLLFKDVLHPHLPKREVLLACEWLQLDLHTRHQLLCLLVAHHCQHTTAFKIVRALGHKPVSAANLALIPLVMRKHSKTLSLVDCATTHTQTPLRSKHTHTEERK